MQVIGERGRQLVGDLGRGGAGRVQRVSTEVYAMSSPNKLSVGLSEVEGRSCRRRLAE